MEICITRANGVKLVEDHDLRIPSLADENKHINEIYRQALIEGMSIYRAGKLQRIHEQNQYRIKCIA